MMGDAFAGDVIENRTFSEIALGESASLGRTLMREDIELFAALSGDVNPSHVDAEYALDSPMHEVVAHGMWGASLLSAVLGTRLPGPGTVFAQQALHFLHPVRVGDTLTATVTARQKFEHNNHIVFDCVCMNQRGLEVIRGSAEVTAPVEKVRRQRIAAPTVTVSDKAQRFRRLLSLAAGLPPVPAAVAHPCDRESLLGALSARDAGLVVPILVGPERRIRALAEEHACDLAGVRICDVPHSHAAAMQAVELARRGEAEVLMKGSLHTDEFMGAVVARDSGLRTARRISHVFVLAVPTYPRLLMITDAAVNIEPTLSDKVDIVQNAIDLARMLGIDEPRAAILAAVETVTPSMRATLDAAALCKMAERGQIRGGLLDGPLAFDNAISAIAARTKGIRSPVAGQADILVVPDLESGNMLAKQLEYLADAVAAGIVMGTRIPIVLTSRADSAATRTASCAVALRAAAAARRVVP